MPGSLLLPSLFSSTLTQNSSSDVRGGNGMRGTPISILEEMKRRTVESRSDGEKTGISLASMWKGGTTIARSMRYHDKGKKRKNSIRKHERGFDNISAACHDRPCTLRLFTLPHKLLISLFRSPIHSTYSCQSVFRIPRSFFSFESQRGTRHSARSLQAQRKFVTQRDFAFSQVSFVPFLSALLFTSHYKFSLQSHVNQRQQAMTTQLNDPASSEVRQLSAPSSHAGAAAQPIIELAKEEPRVAEREVPGAYKTDDGVEGLQSGISRLSVQPSSTTTTNVQQHDQVGEQVDGIEPVGARKAANPPPSSSSTLESVESKPGVQVVEENLRTVADTAQHYLPSQETQQQVLETSKATLTSTVSAASAGASYAGAAIASGAQAVLHAVQPHLPETLGGPHNSANDTTVKEDLDDLVTRAAEAKSGETKAITLQPDASTVDKEEGKGFDITRTHPEPAVDTQQPQHHESPSDKTTLRQPKIPLHATSPAAITLTTASSPTPSAIALAIDKSRSGTASAPPSSPLRSRTEDSKPVILPAPVSASHPLSSLDPTLRSGSPSSTAANFDPTETREKETPSFHSSPSTHRTLDSEKPPLKDIDHLHESSQDKLAVEKEHKHGLKEKIVEKIRSVTHH